MTLSFVLVIQLDAEAFELYHASDARVELEDSELMSLLGHGVDGLSNV